LLHGAHQEKDLKEHIMRKLLLASVAILALSAASPVLAQDNATTGAAIGGTAGATTGAVVGGLVGGPIGAVIGGFAGATIGAEAGVSTATVDYVTANPVEPIYLDGDIAVGTALAGDVVVTDVPSDPAYGYVYLNNRVYIVDKASRKIVQSPGYIIPSKTVTFVEANPTPSITLNGDLAAGVTLDNTVTLNPIPEDRSYSYAYLNDRPVLVDNSSRVIVWVK
jgi:hypothetical protein